MPDASLLNAIRSIVGDKGMLVYGYKFRPTLAFQH